MTIRQICNAVSGDIAQLAGSLLLRFSDQAVHGSYLSMPIKATTVYSPNVTALLRSVIVFGQRGGVANGLPCRRPSVVVPTTCLTGVACEAGTAGKCQGCFNSSEQKFPVDCLPRGLMRYRHSCIASCIVRLTVAGPVQPAFLRGTGSLRYLCIHLRRQRKGSLYRCVP
jgi:hypothetical protein